MNSNHLIFAAEGWVMVALASLEHEINLLGRLECDQSFRLTTTLNWILIGKLSEFVRYPKTKSVKFRVTDTFTCQKS